MTCSYEDGLIARLYQAWYSKPLCNWWGCYLKLPVAMFITKSIRLKELGNHFVWWEPKWAPNSKPFSALASKQKAHDSSRWRTWQNLVESNIYFKLIIYMLQWFVIFYVSLRSSVFKLETGYKWKPSSSEYFKITYVEVKGFCKSMYWKWLWNTGLYF